MNFQKRMDQSIRNNIPVDYTTDFDYVSSQSNLENDSSYEKGTLLSPLSEVYKKPKKINCSLSTQMKKEQYEKDYLKHQSFSLRAHLLSMDSFTRHKKLVNDYVALFVDKSDSKSDQPETNVTEPGKEQHHPICHEGDDLDSWGSRLAKKYWDRLFKEYCLIDLTRFKQNKFGMRWRLEKEVVAGKGQFICGDYSCEERSELRSWEVKFNHVDKGEKRSTLVKVRLCGDCSDKLNHHHQRREVTKHPKKRHLLASAPLDDDIVDRDALSSGTLEEIRSLIKRARSDSNKSLTKDDDDNYSSGSDTQQPLSAGVSGVGGGVAGGDSAVFIMQSTDSSSHNSVTSSGPSSPLSVGSQSEDESVPQAKVARRRLYSKEEDFSQYIADLLL